MDNQGRHPPTRRLRRHYLNLKPLLKFIEPISEEVRKITGPFADIDTLTADRWS